MEGPNDFKSRNGELPDSCCSSVTNCSVGSEDLHAIGCLEFCENVSHMTVIGTAFIVFAIIEVSWSKMFKFK